MSTDSNGVPLTRRQIREQAAAAAAAAASGGQGSAQPVSAPAAPEQRRVQQPPPAQRPRPAAPAGGVHQPAADPGVPQRRSAQPSRQPAPTERPSAPAPQPSRVGHSRPQQPNRPATGSVAGGSTGGAAVSRRALREQTGVQRPVVVPPIQSNAIRTVDETGELSGLRDLGTGRNPHAAPSARPSADSGRGPAAPQPVAQRQPIQRQSAQRQPTPAQAPETQAPPVRRPPVQGLPTRQPGETRPLREQSQAPMPGMLGPETGSRPWPTPQHTPGAPTGAAAAFRPQVARPAEPVTQDRSAPDRSAPGRSTHAPVADTFHQRISAPADPIGPAADDVEDAFDELPAWDAITTAPAAPAVSTKGRPPVVVRDDRDVADEDDLDLDDEDDDDENDHKYTWLHYLILVAVAFVLGLIIWKVGLEGRGVAAPADSSSEAGIVLHSGRTPDLYL